MPGPISMNSPISLHALIATINQELCKAGCRYALVYTDMDPLGRMNVRMSSNVETQQIAALLGSLLEPGEKVKQLLADVFKAHPMQAAVAPNPPDPNIDPDEQETPALVEVPVEDAVKLVLETLLTNLQLKGADKASRIVVPGV